MVKLIIGKKGTGKTKKLIDAVVEATEKSNGCVVCIEKGPALTYDIPHKARLVNIENFGVSGYDAFYGFLCGICAVPPSAEIHKSALGAESSVPWEYVGDTMDAVRRLHDEGYVVICAEQTENAVQLQDFVPEPHGRYAVVFGNEVDGVRQDVVDESDFAVEIPQFGTKHSLNVSVSVGVVLWQMRR